MEKKHFSIFFFFFLTKEIVAFASGRKEVAELKLPGKDLVSLRVFILIQSLLILRSFLLLT